MLGKGLFGRIQSEVQAREKTPGLSMTDILAMPDETGRLISWMLRQRRVERQQIVVFLQNDEACAKRMLGELLDQGFIREIEMHGVTSYSVRLAPKNVRGMPSKLWSALDSDDKKIKH